MQVQYEHGNNALQRAVLRNDVASVIDLLSVEGVDINAVNNMHATALYLVVQKWNDFIIIQHQRPSSADAARRCLEIARLLLSHKSIDPTIVGIYGRTVIHAAIPYACDVDHEDISMLDVLLTDGRIDPRIPSPRIGEPIHFAILSMCNLAAVDRLLKDPRVDPTATFIYQDLPKSPLELAADKRHVLIARRLLEEASVMKTLTPEIRDRLGLTAANVEKTIANAAWKRRRHATMTFAKYWESRDAEGGKRTRRNKRSIGRRANAIGGRRTRRNKRRVREGGQ